jgi:hypothetical protein
MKVVVSVPELGPVGGIQSYSVTVGVALERLGHEVWLFSNELGDAADLAARRGLRVVGSESELPPECDAVLAQEGPEAVEMKDRFGQTPLILVTHMPDTDTVWAPQLEGLVASVVAMNDRIADRLKTLAIAPEVVRLRQPVDLQLFKPRGALSERPRKVLLLGHHLRGPRRDIVTAACEELGLSWTQAGAHGEATVEPQRLIAEADIVVAWGRSLLEAMACGRAVYLYDYQGMDGWVTPQTYPGMEADGLHGLATDRSVDGGEVRRDLSEYRPDMGPANRDLVRRHHNALEHAGSLVRLMERATPSPPPRREPAAEVARLLRIEKRLLYQSAEVQGHLQELHERLAVAEARAQAAEERLAYLTSTRRYRLASRLGRPADRLRSLLGRR